MVNRGLEVGLERAHALQSDLFNCRLEDIVNLVDLLVRLTSVID